MGSIVGIDVGGTFTDVYVFGDDGRALRWRQHLPGHGAVDVPPFDIHHQKHGDALAVGKLEFGTVDGRLVIQTLEGFLRVGHGGMMDGGGGSFKRGSGGGSTIR